MVNKTNISTLGEFGLIKHLTQDIKPKNNTTKYGIGDDAAVLDFKGYQTLVTSDILLEGIHFNLEYVPPAAYASPASRSTTPPPGRATSAAATAWTSWAETPPPR